MNTNRPVRIVLVRPRNPLNIGACARAIANFGYTDLVVIDPYEPVWQETRSAPDAEAVVKNARAVGSWEEAVEDRTLVIGTSSFHQRDQEQAVIELPNLNTHLSAFPGSEPLVLVFGSERSGLSNEELARCQAVIHIPTLQGTPSMNLSHAVAVVLYELRRAGWDPSKTTPPTPATEMESLIHTMAELGQEIDYPAGYEPAARLGRIRQALQGATLPAPAVRYFLSFFRLLARQRR